MRALIILGLTLIFISCNQGQTADEIIDKAIEAAGGNELGKAGVSFKFRDLYYKAQRDHGKYTLERCTDEACEKVHDILTNDGFKRLEEGEAVSLPDSLVDKYSNSVNSVHYFAALPYGLNSAAVHKELVGMDNVKGKSYYKIKVTFDENGGGEDFQECLAVGRDGIRTEQSKQGGVGGRKLGQQCQLDSSCRARVLLPASTDVCFQWSTDPGVLDGFLLAWLVQPGKLFK